MYYYIVACVLAGVMPWDLAALSMESVYCRRRGLASRDPVSQTRAEEERETAMEVWESRLATPSAGWLTIEAVRSVFCKWLARRHGVLTFRTTQVLTRHGCFGGYLCRIAGSPTLAATTVTTASMRRPSTRWRCALPGRLNVALCATS